MSLAPDLIAPAPLTDGELAGLERALAECARFARPFEGIVYRFASMRRANRADLLSGNGSSIHGQRWNPRGIPTVYASLDEVTSIRETFEAQRANGLPIANATPAVLTAIRVTLDRVLDLADPAVRRVLDPLGFTPTRMVDEPWRLRLDSGGLDRGLTIEIGRIAAGLDLQGLVVPSRPNPGGSNLVIFPNHCPADALRVINVDQLPTAN